MSNFTTKQNLTMLWEILLDELNINSNNVKLIDNIKIVFDSNINPFLLRANKSSNIMVLNKQFLGQVVLAVNRLFPTLKQDHTKKKIIITDEEILEPYKIEDIHASRQTNFEKEVERKKIELETYLVPNKPKNLDFSDNNNSLNTKITEMGPLLAEKMAERNLDLEQIQNTNYNATSINPEIWLKSKETSLKNDSKAIINQKKVSFSEMKEIESTKSIFEKLKKNTSESIIDLSNRDSIDFLNNNSINSDRYIEQKSLPLPEYKSELLQRSSNPSSIIQNIPIIPNHEFMKQLNEMNGKIDNLYEIVNSIANLIKTSLPIKELNEEKDNKD
jgi:hypothetical protein